MPQLQTVVLTDRQSTPVDHSFTPRDIRNGVGTVIESSGVPLGDKRLSVSLRQTPSGRYKADVRLVLPVVVSETINGVTVPKVARIASANVAFDFDSYSSEEERNDFVGMLSSALAADKTLVNDTVVKLQGVY